MRLRVAGAQLPVTNDVASNEAAIARAIAFAHREQANILLTPEGSLSGYSSRFDVQSVRNALRRIVALARRSGLSLALGTCFIAPRSGRCHDEIRFYDRDGRFLGAHSKILRCGTLDDPPRGEITEYATRALRTFDLDGITIGGLVCNDLWANPTCTPMPDPHLTQRLARMGARIIFHAVNGSRDGSDVSKLAWQYHEANLRLRALAGRLWIVTVDSCEPTHLQCSSPSGVVNPAGQWVCRAEPIGEQYFVYTIEEP